MLRLTIVLLLVSLVGPTSSAWAQGLRSALVPRAEAQRHGLERGWYAVLDVAGIRDQIESISYEGGTLFVGTRGRLHALDAETGRVLWVADLAGADRSSRVAASANYDHVAVVNGSRLYVLDRKTGKPKWEKRLYRIPQAPPAITDQMVMVPTAQGIIESYPLKDPGLRSHNITISSGDIFRPVVTPNSVAFTTSEGRLAVLYPGTGEPIYTWKTHRPIMSPATHQGQHLFVASLDGFVYAIDETNGATMWQFSAEDPVRKSPVPIAETVYAFPELGGVMAVGLQDGRERWRSATGEQFVAASPRRLYVTDRYGDLVILDAATGGNLGRIDLGQSVRAFHNHYTDRIYLVSESGLIQSLHERELKEPLAYVPPAEKPAEEKPAPMEIQQKGLDEALPAQPAQPAAPAPKPMNEPVDDPFGGGGANDPFGGGGANDPFGGAGGNDPFGGGEAGGEDPFGAAADDPFGM